MKKKLILYSNGDKYEGELKGKKKHGYGIFTWADGSTFTGDWKDDKKHGHATFVEANGDINEGSVHMDLFKMSKDKYVDAMKDLRNKQEDFPIWKEYDFLERDPNYDGKNLDDEKSLQMEIMKLKHENKDFAAELDKAQSLLKIETEIEKENRVYYDEERERLKILAQSYQAKQQEVTKRVDAQTKIINDLKMKLGMSTPGMSSSVTQSNNMSQSKTEDRTMDKIIDEES